MKAATGNYKGVRAITQAEAEALAPAIFGQWDELSQRWTAKHQGYSPDWRAINLIAADRPDAVYCFVICTTRNRHEVWVYDGENCPDANTVEVIWVEKGL